MARRGRLASLGIDPPDNLQLGQQNRLLEIRRGRQTLGCNAHRKLLHRESRDPSPSELRQPAARPDIGQRRAARRLILACAALLLVSPVRAQTHRPDSLLSHLIGRWVLQGPIAGKAVVHDVTFRWVLGGEYVEMHEVSRERTPSGTPAYEAIVYLVRDPRTHEYAALWLDNTDYNAFDPAGVGRGRAIADSIPFVFTASATDRFHTTFVYDRATDSWAWHMDNDDARGRRPFARVRLTRE